MRPLKIPRDELLLRCARTFKRCGYHGTTMDMLSNACGLTKASFYHHYPNKEALLRDVLEWTHEQVARSLFVIAYDDSLAALERLRKIGTKINRLFQDEVIGCLMGVVAVDASYMACDLMPPIRRFLEDWARALAHIYRSRFDEEEALRRGWQSVADYEGAILLARIQGDPWYIDAVTRRALEQMQD